MRLKELRLKNNFLQKELAEMIGVDRTTFSKYETGASEPDFETLLQLADIFNVSTDYLLERDGKKEPAPIPEDRLVHPPEYEFLTPVNRGIADRLIADLVKSQSSNVTPLQISAIALGGGEYDTKADTAITLPKNSTKVRPVQDTAGTDGIPSAPKKT